MTAFEEFGVMPEIIRAVEELDWMLPTAIQAEAIPQILGGGDVLAAAETGSGKTGAFALPILQITYEAMRDLMGTGPGGTAMETTTTTTTTTTGGVRLSAEDRDPVFALDESGLRCQARSESAWAGGRATVGVARGKYYFEAEVTDEGLCRVGWATKSATREIGTDRNSFGYGGTGKKSHNRSFPDYGEAYGRGDVIGCFLDLEGWKMSFSKNGKDLGVAFEIPRPLQGFGFYPAVTLKNAEMLFNFGATPFRHAPAADSGFASLQQAPAEHLAAGGARPGEAPVRSPVCLILEPSRELAEQTHDAIASFKKHLPAPSIEQVLLIGGVPTGPQIEALKRGCEVVTGTPGRTIDLVESGKLDVSRVRFFVLDEADNLLNTGHLESITKLHAKIPKTVPLQVLMFSATLHSPQIRVLAEKICKFPTWIDLKGKDSVPDTVHHSVLIADPRVDDSWRRASLPIKTDGMHRGDDAAALAKLDLSTPDALSLAVKVLKHLMLHRILAAHKMDQAMIFVRTKVDADNLEEFLQALSGGKKGPVEGEFSCTVLHADRSVKERRANLDAFRKSETRFLICTDVAARGIDVAELPFVINFTLPDLTENYIHRIGRVGRADRMGLAISLVSAVPEKVWYHSCAGRGRGCTNTKLSDDGGCAVWYNEAELLTGIEARLGGIPVVRLTAANGYQFPENVEYGKKRNDPAAASAETFLLHAEQLRPAVLQLSQLEITMQHNYFDLRTRFQGFARRAGASGTSGADSGVATTTSTTAMSTE